MKTIAKADNPNQKNKLSNLVIGKFTQLQHTDGIDSTLWANHTLFETGPHASRYSCRYVPLLLPDAGLCPCYTGFMVGAA